MATQIDWDSKDPFLADDDGVPPIPEKGTVWYPLQRDTWDAIQQAGKDFAGHESDIDKVVNEAVQRAIKDLYE